MSQITYTLRIPYNKAKELIQNCKGWDYSDHADEIDTYHINYVDNIHSFFFCLRYYFGNFKLSICPKNFDLIVESSIDGDIAITGDYECGTEFWESLSFYTRDFQLVINYPKEDNDDEDDSWYFTKRIFRKKNDKFEIYYVDSKNRVQKESYGGKRHKYLDIDPSIFDNNFCDHGSGEDYSINLSNDEKAFVYYKLKNLYGIESKKEDYIQLLDKLQIK